MQVAVRDLRVSFQTQDKRRQDAGPLAALGPISFSVASGSFTTLLGPSGSGKSTLVRVVAGLQAASAGRVLLDDNPVRGPSSEVAMMFQDANLMPWRSVQDNIALPLEIQGMPAVQRAEQAEKLLPMLGLADFAAAYPGELSGGMAQRVALGRVLVQRPRLLLLDEPFGALDALTREQISLDLLRIWSQQRQTVIMVTHDINEASLLSDRVLVLSRRPGQLLADIPIDLPRPRTLAMIYTQAFIGLARQVRSAIDRA